MFNNIIDQLKWRYACKAFDPDRQLSETQVQTLKEAFNLTASSYGLQPLKLVVISNQELKKNLVAASMNQKQIDQCSHLLVLCSKTELGDEFIHSYFKLVMEQRGTEEKILAPFRDFLLKEMGEMTPEKLEIWMAKQAYIALGNLLTVCASEGIDSCPMEGFFPEQYDEILGLSEMGLRAVLLLPVGYRSPEDQFASFAKVRRGVSDVVIDLD
ncbi:MAG: NAD(P)H-dependent oxidoreductase [Bacteroidetes bacterium]|nr:NAD(P)H-dependent oxidoreductase [Bacteroidota bacterium]